MQGFLVLSPPESLRAVVMVLKGLLEDHWLQAPEGAY